MLLALLLFLLTQSPPPAPSPAQTASDYYPERGMRMEKSGKVVLECRNTADGTVTRCQVVREEPAGYGFGEAAVRMSAHFRLAPALPDGSAIVEGSVIRIPVTFELK